MFRGIIFKYKLEGYIIDCGEGYTNVVLPKRSGNLGHIWHIHIY